jgi:outer membrane protein
MKAFKNRFAVPAIFTIGMVVITLLAFNYANDPPPKRSNIGYLNTGELWVKMPEKVEADTTLAIEKRDLEAYFNKLNTDYRTSYSELADTTKKMSDFIRQEKIKDLKALEERIVKYKQEGESKLKAKQDELYAPIRKKMQTAIDDIAKEHGYDYILDSYYGNIIYVKNDADNVMDLVLKKLNISSE